MKTTFSRQFALIAALLLVCMIFTGVSFRFLMLGYLKNDKKETLSADAAAVASLAEAYDSTGELEENWDFRLSLSLFSDVGEAEALVCDENGFIVLCSCDEFNCEHIGQQVDANLITEIDANGETFRVGALSGIHDDRRYIAGRPIVANDTDETIGYVIISSDMTQIADFMQRSSSLFFYVAIVVLVLALAAATFLSHQQAQPLAKVADAARRFGRGELDTRVTVPDSCGEEVVDLANAFNTMADSLEKSEQRRQEFVANVSHELKTPMTTIGGYIDGMLDGTIPPEKQQHYMQIVSGEVRRLSRLVRNMLDIAKLQAMGVEESRKTRFDLGEELSDVLITFEQKIYNKHLDVRVNLPDKPVWTRAERDSITQVIYNLIDNAIKFCPDGGRLALRLQLDGGKARVTVENTGPTIDKDELPLLFLLLDFSEKKTYRSIVPVWVGKFLLGSYLSVLGMAVLGSRMAKASHPFFAIVSVSQPLSTQRADALYILVFVMLCVLRITLFAVLAAHLLRLCFPKLRYTSTLCLLSMLGIAGAASKISVSGIWEF